jgi:hypothetical protein
VSGFAKARAIVLGYLASQGGGDPEPAHGSTWPVSGKRDFVDVYNQRAA